jgi:hypothetical protein
MFVRNNRTHSVERKKKIDILTGKKHLIFLLEKKKIFELEENI